MFKKRAGGYELKGTFKKTGLNIVIEEVYPPALPWLVYLHYVDISKKFCSIFSSGSTFDRDISLGLIRSWGQDYIVLCI